MASGNTLPDPLETSIRLSDTTGKHGRRTGTKKKSKKPVEKPKNVVSDETARRWISWLKGLKEFPDAPFPTSSASHSVDVRKDASVGPEEDLQEQLAAAIREKLRPWLWSIMIHSMLVILLALLFVPRRDRHMHEIILGIGDELTEFVRDIPLGKDFDNHDFTIITPLTLPPVEMPKQEVAQVDLAQESTEIVHQENSGRQTTISFHGRDPGSRARQLARGGGNGQSDQAVIDGLRWLVRVQFPDGSWRLGGPYRDGAIKKNENRVAATAMALLAFQGYGVLPEMNQQHLAEFSKSLRNGWNWLLQQQDPTSGCFFREGASPYSHRFYTHGLCTIALCEALAMTGDESLREPAKKAIDYCLRMQSVSGGAWRYHPDRWNPDSDVSVTGWILMALKSGQAAGIEVPDQTFQKVDEFLDRVARDQGSQYVYRPEEPEKRISMTAEALLCRELLGWKHHDPRLKRGIELLTAPEHLPTFTEHYKRDVYYWYYATQAIHHYGGAPWDQWNKHTRDLLVEYQEKKGSEAGSWSPTRPVNDTWGGHYGRLYTTCLSIYILEVYYRHLRIYEQQ